tara:strand:- start:342 stop:629 length:288 start_codon:yes stop_codon:yes gene_type:complete
MAKQKELTVKTEKAVKIHDKHLKEMQNLVNTINSIQFNIGKMEIQKHSALKELAKQQDGVSALQDTLLREYGSYDVNIHDGTINWPESKKDENEG